MLRFLYCKEPQNIINLMNETTPFYENKKNKLVIYQFFLGKMVYYVQCYQSIKVLSLVNYATQLT